MVKLRLPIEPARLLLDQLIRGIYFADTTTEVTPHKSPLPGPAEECVETKVSEDLLKAIEVALAVAKHPKT